MNPLVLLLKLQCTEKVNRTELACEERIEFSHLVENMMIDFLESCDEANAWICRHTFIKHIPSCGDETSAFYLKSILTDKVLNEFSPVDLENASALLQRKKEFNEREGRQCRKIQKNSDKIRQLTTKAFT